MPETVVVELPDIAPFSRMTAEWWEETSKFVVIRGTTGTDGVAFALRLDLDKRAFLDRTGEEETDRLVPDLAKTIAERVQNERRKRLAGLPPSP